MMAALSVSWARRLLVSESIRSSSPWAREKNSRTFSCLAAPSGAGPLRWSTKKRYPLSVGTRPALVWGWLR